MTELKDQIRSYFDEVDPPFTADELMSAPQRIQHPRRVMTARAFAFVAAAALVVLLLVGGPLFLLERSTTVETQPAPPADIASTVPSPTVTVAASPATTLTTVHDPTQPPFDPATLAAGWVRVPLDEYYDDRPGSAPDVALSDAGLVLLSGASFHEGSPPVILRSSDGILWERSAPFGVGDDVRSVVAGGPGFVAVGSWCDMADDVCLADPAIWTSTDGAVWERVPSDSEVFPGCSTLDTAFVDPHLEEFMRGGCQIERPAEIWNVEATEHGLVAVGLDPGGVLQWNSTDGVNWTRIPHSARPSYPVSEPGFGWWFNNQDQAGAWTSLGILQPGVRCVDRFDGDEFLGQDCWGYVFTSPDGEKWTPEVDGDEIFRETFIYKVLEVPDGVVVVGVRLCVWGCPSTLPSDPSGAVVWFSEDGQHWVPGSFEDPQSVSRFGDVVATDFGYVALAIGHDSQGALWYSEDGKDWDRVPMDPEMFGATEPYHLTAHGSQIVIGAIEPGSPPDIPSKVSIWMWSPPE